MLGYQVGWWGWGWGGVCAFLTHHHTSAAVGVPRVTGGLPLGVGGLLSNLGGVVYIRIRIYVSYMYPACISHVS